MAHTLAIRREDKNIWERRVPLIPEQAAQLIREHDLNILVQPSERRVFTDEQYRLTGVPLSEDISNSQVVLGVKEIPLGAIVQDTTYLFFSHTIKGQSYNMPLLRRLMERRCQLIDYERIVNDQGRRLVFFGRHAGLAGMVETLFAIGQRLKAEGITDAANPFNEIRQPCQYHNLEEAKAQVQRVGNRIREDGLPEEITPLVCGVLGYGNVAKGVQEILDYLPTKTVSPRQLLTSASEFTDNRVIYTTEFKERDTVCPIKAGKPFLLEEYYRYPERYRARFADYLPHLSILVNTIYWDERFPVLVNPGDVRTLFKSEKRPNLRVIGDITCDIEGSIAITLKATLPDHPSYVYDTRTGSISEGVTNLHGPVIMAVENLPTELAAEASEDFGRALLPLLPALSKADFNTDLAHSGLPDELKRATIVYRGQLTEPYRYLEKHLSDS